MNLAPENRPETSTTEHRPDDSAILNLASQELPRRKFLTGMLSGLALAANLIPISVQVEKLLLDSEITPQRKVLLGLLKLFQVENDIKAISNPLDFFTLSQSAVAQTFTITDGEPLLNEFKAILATTQLVESRMQIISEKLRQRSDILDKIVSQRDVLLEMFESLSKGNSGPLLTKLSSALAPHTREISSEEITKILGEEKSQIESIIRDRLLDATKTTLYETEAFSLSPDTTVYRQRSGGFSFSPDSLTKELSESVSLHPLYEPAPISPEVYIFGAAPPERYALHIRNDYLRGYLTNYLINGINEIFDANHRMPWR